MTSNCDDVRGLLPWLLNGTLNGDERRQVLQHLSTCETCRQDLADTRLAAEIFDQHPPAEAILALAWDETPSGIDPALLDEHLAECPRCAADLELARMSRRLEEDDRIVPLTRRTAPAPPASALPSSTPATPWRGWKTAALAAGLAVVVASAGWFQTAGYVDTLEEQLAERPPAASAPPAAGGPGGGSAPAQQLAADLEARLREREKEAEALRAQEQELREKLDQLAEARPAAPMPQINSWADTVTPSADVVRGSGPAGPKEVPARTYATLLLTPAHSKTYHEHAVEIVDAAGKVVWNAGGLTVDENGYYYLTLPPGALSPGAYTIRVSGLADGRREPLETYSIRVK